MFSLTRRSCAWSRPCPRPSSWRTDSSTSCTTRPCVATKAARCRLVAPGKLLVDFGLRRAHGARRRCSPRARLSRWFRRYLRRASAELYGMPPYGTMAHSFIQAHDTEKAAFEHSAARADNVTALLIDTYDTEAGARKVVHPRPAPEGAASRCVPCASTAAIWRRTRKRCAGFWTAADLNKVRIFSSGGLGEYVLADLLARDAPIDGFGVGGTHLDTSADAPYLDCALQTRGVRRPTAAQALRGAGSELARAPADLAPLRRRQRWPATCHCERSPGRRAAGPARHMPRRVNGHSSPEPLTDIRARSANELKRLPAPLRRSDKRSVLSCDRRTGAARIISETVDRETTRN